MTLALARSGLLGIACGLALGCGDDGGGVGYPPSSGGAGAAGSSAGAGSGGANTGGMSSGGMSSAGNAAGGNTTGGNAAGMSSAGAGLGGAGGAAIDPNGGAPTGPAKTRHKQVPSGTYPEMPDGYWEYLPPHYGNGERFPLLIFRHGIGENGNGTTELEKVKVNGPPKLIEANQWPEERKFVVLSVQHKGTGCAVPKETDDFIEFALAKYDIDPQRVYLTGLSCGAIGSWNYLAEHTNEAIAAAVLVCGDGRSAFTKAGCSLGKVPIWAFHGDADPTVNVAGSTGPVASLKACTAPAAVDVKLTVYPGVQHDSWTMTYNLSNPENDIYAWLLTHTKD